MAWQGTSLPRLPWHPSLSASEWKPSGIPVAVVWRPRGGGQYQLSLSERQAGSCHSGEISDESCHALLWRNRCGLITVEAGRTRIYHYQKESLARPTLNAHLLPP